MPSQTSVSPQPHLSQPGLRGPFIQHHLHQNLRSTALVLIDSGTCQDRLTMRNILIPGLATYSQGFSTRQSSLFRQNISNGQMANIYDSYVILSSTCRQEMLYLTLVIHLNFKLYFSNFYLSQNKSSCLLKAQLKQTGIQIKSRIQLQYVIPDEDFVFGCGSKHEFYYTLIQWTSGVMAGHMWFFKLKNKYSVESHPSCVWLG